MSKLIPIWKIKITDKCLNKQSLHLQEALKRLRNRNIFIKEENEKVIDPFNLYLMLHEVSKDFNNKKGNQNAKRI